MADTIGVLIFDGRSREPVRTAVSADTDETADVM
jgi:hypothetical protein